MKLDLLIALASVAVILSPCLIEALRRYEFERYALKWQGKAPTHRLNRNDARLMF
jgi:hypothetical protein